VKELHTKVLKIKIQLISTGAPAEARKILCKCMTVSLFSGFVQCRWRIKTNDKFDKSIRHKNITNCTKAQRLSWFGNLHRMSEWLKSI